MVRKYSSNAERQRAYRARRRAAQGAPVVLTRVEALEIRALLLRSYPESPAGLRDHVAALELLDERLA